MKTKFNNPNEVYEFRWNPVLKWWVMYAASRQQRPLLPKDCCPFCPGSGKVPDKFDVMVYQNDFPIMKYDPSETNDISCLNTKLYRSKKSYGKCEVILYTSNHNAHIGQLTIPHLVKLINLWRERYKELGTHPKVKYVYIFENRGEVVGVTIHHPHVQIYAYSFIPKKI